MDENQNKEQPNEEEIKKAEEQGERSAKFRQRFFRSEIESTERDYFIKIRGFIKTWILRIVSFVHLKGGQSGMNRQPF